jgi:hypothetical protein
MLGSISFWAWVFDTLDKSSSSTASEFLTVFMFFGNRTDLKQSKKAKARGKDTIHCKTINNK